MVTVISDQTTRGSDLHGSTLSVLETIAPAETVLDPIPEDDDPDVYHMGLRPEIAASRRTGNPFWTLCGKLVYERRRGDRKRCRACEDFTRDMSRRKGRD